MRILTINPGSTSTKIGIFDNGKEIFTKTLRHDADEITSFHAIYDQLDFRNNIIVSALAEAGIELSSFDAVAGRGGLLKPIKSGTYEINQEMLDELKSAKYGSHASNLGAPLAHAIGSKIGKPSYIVDPVVVDELMPAARISGHPLFKRVSIFHALNQKAIAKQYAKDIGKNYSDLNLVVVHMGGGVSVGAHLKGQVVHVNNALGGEGPFSPERSGSLPANALIDMCYSGEYTHKQMKEISVGKGGMVGFFGTNDFASVMKKIDDPNVKLIIDGLIFQLSREISGASVVFKGECDAILLTGGLAYSEYLTNAITEYVKHIGKVFVYPGEDELKALEQGVARILDGSEKAKTY